MARTKQVFPRDEVAHLWANRAQDSARDAGGSFFFTGQALYSYGSHFCIAYILGAECGPDLAGRVIWNDAKYSNTTAKHQSHARHALSRTQWERALHMPSIIGMGSVVDPRRIERDLAEKKLPWVAPMIVDAIVGGISGLVGKRYGSGPFELILSDARSAEAFALAMYARAGRKYPLPLVDSRPTSSDRAEWAAWVRGMSRVKLASDYAAQVKSAKDYAAQAESNAAECTPGFPYAMHRPGQQWEARNVVSSTYDVAQRAQQALTKAASLHMALKSKPLPPALVKLSTRMEQLADLFKARRDDFTHAEQRDRVVYDIRQAIKNVREIRVPGTYRRVWADMETLFSRAGECGVTDSLYMGLAERYARIGAANSARGMIDSAENALGVARSYLPQHTGDALRHATEALTRAQAVERILSINRGMLAFIRTRLDTTIVAARGIIADTKAAIILREAETLRAWIANESNARPSYEAGTYARIVESRGIVETTRGASVPIEHACRLSRMYAIAMRRGGQSWPDGEGPMVGHYRVNSIGADGALTIGCHEFDAVEGARLHALLATCKACAEVTA